MMVALFMLLRKLLLWAHGAHRGLELRRWDPSEPAQAEPKLPRGRSEDDSEDREAKKARLDALTHAWDNLHFAFIRTAYHQRSCRGTPSGPTISTRHTFRALCGHKRGRCGSFL